MNKHLEFYFDFVSPYSYIAHKEIVKLVKNNSLKKIGNLMVAQYNSPWALPPFRHNEIMVRISR